MSSLIDCCAKIASLKRLPDNLSFCCSGGVITFFCKPILILAFAPFSHCRNRCCRVAITHTLFDEKVFHSPPFEFFARASFFCIVNLESYEYQGPFFASTIYHQPPANRVGFDALKPDVFTLTSSTDLSPLF